MSARDLGPLSLWLADGAHPYSPAGGGGPGAARLPGILPSFPFFSAPAVGSPAGANNSPQQAPPDLQARRIAEDSPLSGKLPLSLGLGSVLRIPVPGSRGLAIELTPRGWTPKGGSTSSLFFQELSGKRHLRLDFGYNKNSQMFEWHWNQKGVADVFQITNHTTVGPAEQALGNVAKYYKYAGRTLLVIAAAADIYSIAVASNPLRRSVQVVSGWAAASAGCQVGGAAGAAGGTFVVPGFGTAVGGFIGCAIGAFIGYTAAEAASGYLYDWVAGTEFKDIEPEPEPEPSHFVGGGGSSGGGGASGSW